MNAASPILRPIPGGLLSLTIDRADMELDRALAFAARRNPKRQFLFVSRILGRHMPTRPRELREGAAALARKLVAPPLPCLFIGMSETATTLGQAVWQEWLRQGGGESLYLDTTRRPTGGEVAFSFREDHSHAPVHLVHQPAPEVDPNHIFSRAACLVIVDDEATTGRTAAALADAYAKWRGSRPEVILLTLVHWKGAQEPPFRHHALIEGSFQFTATEPPAEAPPGHPASYHPVQVRRGTRHGLAAPQASAGLREKQGRVLIIGEGEFGFLPFLLAEAIEAAGGEAFVQATTRSPVMNGGAITHVRSFPALDGSNATDFLYNVPDDHDYERVILCGESAAPPEAHPLRRIPRLEIRSNFWLSNE